MEADFLLFFIFLLPPPLFLEFPFFFLVPSFLNFTFKNRGRLTQIERDSKETPLFMGI